MKRRVWLLLVLAPFLMLGCSKNYNSERAYFKTAQSFKKMNDTGQRIQALEKISEDYPGTAKAAESLFLISRLKIQMKDYDGARTVLGEVIQNYSSSGSWAAEARKAIASLYEVEGRWEEAEAAYWQLAEYHYLHGLGLYAPIHIIRHHAEAKDEVRRDAAYERAKEHYEKVLRMIGPIQASVSIRSFKAMAHYAAGRTEEAMKDWISIAKEYPGHPDAARALLAAAQVAYFRNQTETSLHLYEQFIAQYPQSVFNREIMTRIARHYHQKGNYAKSREWLQKALDYPAPGPQRDPASIKLLIGRSYQKEGNWEKADQIYREIEQDFPDSVASLQIPFLEWEYYEGQGQADKAAGILTQALARYELLVHDMSNTLQGKAARRLINSVYAKQGRWDKVMENIDFAIANEKRPAQKGNWLFVKAVVAEARLHDKQEAMRLYQDFLSRYSDHQLVGVAKRNLELLTQA